MRLLCVVCSIEQSKLRDVKEASYIINGQSVCLQHADTVSAEPGTESVVIGRPR